MRTPLSRLLCALLLASALITPLRADEPLILGVFPRHNYTETVRMFSPLAKHLSEQLGREVRLETTKDFASFWDGVAKRHYDIVHYNQYHYLRSHKEFGYEIVLKNEEHGRSTISSVLIVRSDSGIKRPEDLKDKTVIFGGDTMAMMSYIVPTALLRDAGLGADNYATEFARNPPNALMAVYFGQAAACGVGDAIPNMPALKAKMDMNQLTTIATSEPLPHLAWAVKDSMADELRERIRNALSQLGSDEAGRAILQRAKLSALVPANDGEYNAHRAIVRKVLNEDL